MVHHGITLADKHYDTLVGFLGHAPYMLQSSFAPAVQIKGWDGIYPPDLATLAEDCEGCQRLTDAQATRFVKGMPFRSWVVLGRARAN